MTRKAFLVPTSAILMMMIGALLMMSRCSSGEVMGVPGSSARLCQAYKDSTVIYCIHKQKMSWSSAFHYCASQGGFLSDMDNAEEHDVQINLGKRAGLGSTFQHFWLSGSTMESKNAKPPATSVYKWMPSGKTVNTSLFREDQPDGKGQEHCICSWVNTNGFTLSDWYCSIKLPFMCKFSFEMVGA